MIWSYEQYHLKDLEVQLQKIRIIPYLESIWQFLSII
jgi:hypothetical protein